MKHQFAFCGFRHPHIFSLLERVGADPRCEIVAVSEEDPVTRGELQSSRQIRATHDSLDQILQQSPCTVVAIGDVYAKRGAMAIAALGAGKHVISDKPICTSLEEWKRIAELSKEKGLSVGCQLDLVESGAMRRLKEVIEQKWIGSICTITIAAQHPLRFGSRAAWYFEAGQHGGTINDIGVHIFDLVPWLTGLDWITLLAAREWNAKASGATHFHDCAQIFATLANGASCFADMSYLAPDQLGYELSQYWRVTVHGTAGMAEASYQGPHITVVADSDAAAREIPAVTDPAAGYLQDFLGEIAGTPARAGVTTARVLGATRHALEAREAAHSRMANRPFDS